jgi:hypothetical protein
MNNKYTIKVGSPILRPGISIETEVSAKYAKEALEEALNIARDINKPIIPEPFISDIVKTQEYYDKLKRAAVDDSILNSDT